jgi:hypothetical protein
MGEKNPETAGMFTGIPGRDFVPIPGKRVKETKRPKKTVFVTCSFSHSCRKVGLRIGGN